MTMKRQLITEVLAVTAVALGATAAFTRSTNAQPAPGERGFWCDNSSGVPTTMYQNAQGNREPWIRWVSDAFPDWDPMTRCNEVSGRLETYRRNKELKYITVGVINNQNVVCTASQVNGRCQGLIFTLKPGQDAVRTLNNLLAWREGQAGAPSLYESTGVQNPYIDVSGRLGDDDAGVAAPAQTPANSQPTGQQQPTPQQPMNNEGGSREL